MADLPLIDILPDAPTPGMAATAFDTAAFAWVAAQATYRAQLVALANAVNAIAAQVAAVSAQNAQATWGYPASQSPAANQVPVVKADGSTAFPGPISVGNANVNGGSALIDWVEKGVTALMTVTAGISGTVTGNATLTRFMNLVFITLPTLTGTSSGANTFTISGVPSSFRPAAIRRCWLGGGVTDNSTASYGWLSVNTNGTLAVYHDPSGGAWLLTGTRALQTSMIVYEI